MTRSGSPLQRQAAPEFGEQMTEGMPRVGASEKEGKGPGEPPSPTLGFPGRLFPATSKSEPDVKVRSEAGWMGEVGTLPGREACQTSFVPKRVGVGRVPLNTHGSVQTHTHMHAQDFWSLGSSVVALGLVATLET